MDYFPGRLEQQLRAVKHRSAMDIFAAIKADLLAFARHPTTSAAW